MSNQLLDAIQLRTKLTEMANAMANLVADPEQAAIIGIRTRGALIAQRIHKIIAVEHEWNLPLGILDITLYRDDLSQLASFPLVRKTQLDFDVTGRTIILIDDVIYTGRTIRSAIDEIIDFGRPRAIRLGVLVDRGGREYPIQPDYAALTVKSASTQVVKVLLKEIDLDERVIVTDSPPTPPEAPDANV
ncbi:MAG: bifunctional pyr operon transcriptional regulator/uracil phosphoribosyltransferase PyrR [bacterium]|nr:bifunctional pyr operon transcriptional regulator/uracil phosphoribosyltransferase PyrR [bacterium]